MSSHASRIIEILGLAGTGKSTTCKKLGESCPDVLPDYRVARSRLPAAALRSLWWFARAPRNRALRDPGGGWTGLYLSIHMEAMIQDLLFRRKSRLGTLFLDQGPIFNCISAERLAKRGKVHESIPGTMRRLLMENLGFLDAIVVLEADPPILLGRIDDRVQDHEIKGSAESSARAFLEDYRERYESILDEIQNRADVQIVRLDTGYKDPDQILNEICGTFELATYANAAPAELDPAR